MAAPPTSPGTTRKKIYHGQQLVLFGRYDKPGKATLTLNARLTGEDKTYTTTFDFPETDTANPELERLWALAQIEQIELKEAIGQTPAAEAKDAITNLGVAYQLVTDHTAMVVLDDATHDARGIDRKNRDRTALERAAQSARAQTVATNYQVDANQPAYSAPAPHVSRSRGFGGGGGGALESTDIAFLLFFAFLAWAAWLGRRAMAQKSRDD